MASSLYPQLTALTPPPWWWRLLARLLGTHSVVHEITFDWRRNCWVKTRCVSYFWRGVIYVTAITTEDYA